MNNEHSLNLPPNVLEVISETLVAIREDPEHFLYSSQREKIYLSFGDSRLNLLPPTTPESRSNYAENKLGSQDILRFQWMHARVADFVIGELSILTTRYAFETVYSTILLNELNEYEVQILDTVKEILELDRLLLDNEVSIETAKEYLSDKYWYFEFTDETYNLSRVYCAAVFSLNIIVYGPKKPARYSLITPDNWKAISMDYASEAANAYSAIPNPMFRDWQVSEIPVSFDRKKRLEFWEWWLTEAIPQAWELANSTYQPKEEGQ